MSEYPESNSTNADSVLQYYLETVDSALCEGDVIVLTSWLKDSHKKNFLLIEESALKEVLGFLIFAEETFGTVPDIWMQQGQDIIILYGGDSNEVLHNKFINNQMETAQQWIIGIVIYEKDKPAQTYLYQNNNGLYVRERHTAREPTMNKIILHGIPIHPAQAA